MPTIMAGIRTMLVMTIALTGKYCIFIGAGDFRVAIYRGLQQIKVLWTIAGSPTDLPSLAITVDVSFL